MKVLIKKKKQMYLYFGIFIFLEISSIACGIYEWKREGVQWMAFLLISVAVLAGCLKNYHFIFQWALRNEMEIEELLDLTTLQEDMLGTRQRKIIDHISQIYMADINLEIAQKRVEFSALQSQINPHFLYNTLEAIRGQALINSQMEIAKMAECLARFYRYCISSKSEFVRISAEIENVKDYFQIQQYRFEERFEIKMKICDNEVLKYYIPKMTLQPLIENAMIHGLEKKKGSGTIIVRIEQSERKIYLTVTDNGIGISDSEVEKINQQLEDWRVYNTKTSERGIAVQNVNGRIKLLFGDGYGVVIRSTLGMGTDAEVIIPIIDDTLAGEYLKEYKR